MTMIVEPGLSPLLQATTATTVVPKWTEETVLSMRRWSAKLFSFRTTRSAGFRFVPGQFARLGIAVNPGDAGALVWRAYSMVSANYDEHLEFFSIVVPSGEFTTRLEQFVPGDRIFVEKMSYGFLTADRFAGGRDLWFLASGTGLAPFLSILHDPQIWIDYENLFLVHSVRQADELVYREEIASLSSHALLCSGRARLRYIPVVTRESVAGALTARLPQLISDGRLEAATGVALDVERSRLMICGNPQMASDMRDLLTSRGFRVGRRGNPGQLAFENYW